MLPFVQRNLCETDLHVQKSKELTIYSTSPCLLLARVKPPWAVAHVNSIKKRFYEFGVLGERQIFGIQVGPYDETHRYSGSSGN